jgi:hypothetical protein
MDSTALYYALSTIAQCAAALAALIGFLGLWRLDRLREEVHQCVLTLYRVMGGREFSPSEELIVKDAKDVIKGWDSLSSEQQTRVSHEGATARRLQEELARREYLRTEQQRLMRVLSFFLVVTLMGILAPAIGGIVQAERLKMWAWTPWLLYGAGSLLGLLPVFVIIYVARKAAHSIKTLLGLTLLFMATPALAGPTCTTYEEKTLNRLHTLCSDDTRAVSTYNRTLERWDTTITGSPRKACTGQMNAVAKQVEMHCR